MIDEEMEEFEPEDYISSLPPIPPPSFAEGSALAQEYQRVASDPSSRLSALDDSRYQVKPPRFVNRALAHVMRGLGSSRLPRADYHVTDAVASARTRAPCLSLCIFLQRQGCG